MSDDVRAAFDSELSIQSATATTWKLLAPLVWNGTKGDTFVVPVGFVTDFASVPRFLHWLVSPYGAYTRAAVLHDWLCVQMDVWWRDRRSGNPEAALPPANSHDTDGIFRRVMQDLGVPWPKRWIMWAAVRWAAALNPARRYGLGLGRDLPKMIGASLLVLGNPFIVLATLAVLLALGSVKLIGLLSEPLTSRKRRATERQE